MIDMTEVFQYQSKTITSTEHVFEVLTKAIEDTNINVQKINGISNNIEKEKIKISKILQNLATTAEEKAASTEEVAASAEEQSASMEEITNISGNLAELAKELKASIATL